VEIWAVGIKTAPSSACKNAREIFDWLGVGSLFDGISDGYRVEKQKPAPDLFMHESGQLGLSPSQCKVVEYAATVIEASSQAGWVFSSWFGCCREVG